MRIADLIAYNCRLEPNKPAIIVGTQIVTYGMLDVAVRSCSARIAALGLTAGTVVGVWIGAPGRHMAVSLALAELGLVSAPVTSLARIALVPGIAVVIVDSSFVSAAGLKVVAAADDWFTSTDPPSHPGVAIADTDPCRIVMSSGTTGRPKPIIHTFASLEFHADTLNIAVEISAAATRLQCSMDLVSNWGYAMALAVLSRSKCFCLAPDAADTIRMMSLYSCDYLSSSVFHLKQLLDEQARRFTPLPALLGAGVGGSFISAEMMHTAQSLLTRRIALLYGSSELGLSGFGMAGAEALADGATGAITPWTEIEVIDPDGNVLGPGGEGELRLRADVQPIFDAGNPDPRPWFYPGDRGTVSAAGQLVITGRTTDIINIGGGKFAPERIEQMLLRLPSVRDAGVISIRGSGGLEIVRAGIVSSTDLNEADLAEHCRRNFEVSPITDFARLVAIPRGPTGKILRSELRRLLET